MMWARKSFLRVTALGSLCVFFSFAGCSGQTNTETKDNGEGKVEVVTVGVPKSQSKSFAENYAYASKFFDAHQLGMDLNKQGKYLQAVEAFNQSISFADNRAKKAMAYNGLAISYAGLGDTKKQIEYLEREAKTTLNENHRAELLKQIGFLKSQSNQ